MTDDLIARVEALRGPDNRLDAEIEEALFIPDRDFIACRRNSAGTKVIYTRVNGARETYWAQDWTHDPKNAVRALRAHRENNR